MAKNKVVIECATRTVRMKAPSGEDVEFKATNTLEQSMVHQAEGKALEDITVVSKFPDVFPEELHGMPPECEVEFVIELKPGTAPIAKRPYRM